MASKQNEKDLSSPLLMGAPTDYASSDSHAVNVESSPADAKFAAYESKQKARANNSMKICGVPFNYFMLLCIMFLTFGSYWCYDIPGSIETELTAWFGDSYTHASNLLFYSIYSWPNVILPFFGGFILDKITGIRKGAMLFCGLVALGQLIFSLGSQWKIYYLALFGRFVFGLGGESLTVAQNTFTVKWFDGKRLALAFGLVVAFSRIGTSINFVVSPILASSPITYELDYYSNHGSCDTSVTNSVNGPINSCQNGIIAQCDKLKSDDLPFVSLYGLPKCTGYANYNQTIPGSGVCFATNIPVSNSYRSMMVTINPDTNEYSLQTWQISPNCTGTPTPTAPRYFQGNGCAGGGIDQWSFKVNQVITAPCYFAQFTDQVNCDPTTEENRYGFTRDDCVTPMDPSKANYRVTIDPGSGVPSTLWFGMGMCALSFLACIAASYFDFWGEAKVDSDRAVYLAGLSSDEQEYVKKLDAANEPSNDDISFAMVKRIPSSAWLLFIITAVFYIAILNFYQVASDLMQNTGNMISSQLAGKYMAIPNIVAIVGSPLGGYTLDKNGRALVLIAVACGMLICAHVFFLALAYGWVSASPIPVMLWLGCTYSLGASCLWPILAFIVEKEVLGTAYGCMTAVQNLFLAIAALLIGQLQDWASGPSHPAVLQYTLPIMIFIACAAIALICTLALIVLDRSQNGGALNASAEERAARIAKEEAEQEVKNQATRVPTAASGTSETSPLNIETTNSEDDQIVSSSPSKSLNPPSKKH